MVVLPFAIIRSHYSDVAAICKKSKEPIFLIEKGRRELVVLDVDTFEEMKQEIVLREKILHAHASYLAGENTHSLEETFKMMDVSIGG